MSQTAVPVLPTRPQPVLAPVRKSEQIAPAHAAPRCRHQKVNGVRCGSPALAGQKHCYYHDKFHRRAVEDFPCLEDANSVAYLINQVVRNVSTGFMDLRQATVLLYAAQNMIPLLNQLHLEPDAAELADSSEEASEESEKAEAADASRLATAD